MKEAMKTNQQIEAQYTEVMEYSSKEKLNLLKYMRAFEPFAVAGKVYDCRTGERLKTENAGYNDGTYIWTEEDIYHIEKYNAAVTEDFLKAATGSGQSR